MSPETPGDGLVADVVLSGDNFGAGHHEWLMRELTKRRDAVTRRRGPA